MAGSEVSRAAEAGVHAIILGGRAKESLGGGVLSVGSGVVRQCPIEHKDPG